MNSKPNERAKAFELYKQGFNQKEIAKKVSVNPHTVGRWIKDWQTGVKAITNLKRLLTELTEQNAPIRQIKQVSDIIKQLIKIFSV